MENVDIDGISDLLSLIFAGVDSLLPSNMEVGLVLASGDVNPVVDEEVMPELPVLQGLPASIILPQGISAVSSISFTSDTCNDIVCNFIKNNFGEGVSMYMVMSLKLDPAINFELGIGNLALSSLNCGNTSRNTADMDVGVFAEAIAGPPLTSRFGLRVGLAFEMAQRPKSTCDIQGYLQPLVLQGTLYVGTGVAPEFGGTLALIGVVYQLFGLDMLHISDLGVGMAFVAVSLIL